MLGRGIRLALAATLVVTQWFVSSAINDARAAGTPAAGYAVTDFATGFSTFLFYGPGPIGVAFDAQGNLYSTAYFSGGLYRFPPTGGTFETSQISSVGYRVTGLAFDGAGRLFVARQGEGDVLELDPVTGAVKGTVASGICNPNAVVVDPLSGDLFISSCGTVQRLSGYQGSPVTPTLYTANVSVDGLTFAPDGTLYGAGGGPVYRITGTADSVPGTASVIASVPAGDGIALVAPAAGSPITQLAVNRNDGIITLVDFSAQPVTYTDIVTGGSRGDFVGVGPDKCLYATQSDEIEKVTAADGSCPFLPSGVTGSPALTFCSQQGQMVDNASLISNGWSMNYGISACEGLVVSHVALGIRLMAERMSVPYLDLVTCNSSSDISHCMNTTTRHITLRPDAVEPQTGSSAYTRVHLIQPAFWVALPGAAGGLCQGRAPCANTVVSATYRVDLTPALGGAVPLTYLDVIQRYEFYQDFFTDTTNARGLKALSCEPSDFGPNIPVVISPIPDCARWKPIVSYSFQDNTATTLLVSLNATGRFHFTPDGVAVRGSTFIRDCDNNAPTLGCFPRIPLLNYLFDVFGKPGQPENPMHTEAAIRAVVADPTGSSSTSGRYDNVHQTAASGVQAPAPPPGCPECVHIHWRWGADIPGIPTVYGSGQPLIGDAEPAAQPKPTSHQQVDVALVPYHSEQLAPSNYLLLLKGANANDLNLSRSGNQYVGGVTKGSETLNYPPDTCSDMNHLASWGQCGQVLYMSATSYTVNKHDEDSDQFFAFGGFFCQTCFNPEYLPFLPGFHPVYAVNNHVSLHPTAARGSQIRIQFYFVNPGVQLYDLLPRGFTVVSAQIGTYLSGGQHLINCPVSTDGDGHPVVACDLTVLQTPSLVTIVATVGSSMAAGSYDNTVRAIWGPTQLYPTAAGDYKNSDTVTVT